MGEVDGHALRGRLALLLVPFADSWFGFDLEQLSAIAEREEAAAGEEEEILLFHRLLGLASGDYRRPRTLAVKGDEARGLAPYRLQTEAPEDVLELDCRDIRPLPPLLEPFSRRRGVWGVAPLSDGRLVLLFDCQQIDRRVTKNCLSDINSRRKVDEAVHAYRPA